MGNFVSKITTWNFTSAVELERSEKRIRSFASCKTKQEFVTTRLQNPGVENVEISINTVTCGDYNKDKPILGTLEREPVIDWCAQRTMHIPISGMVAFDYFSWAPSSLPYLSACPPHCSRLPWFYTRMGELRTLRFSTLRTIQCYRHRLGRQWQVYILLRYNLLHISGYGV